MFPVPEYLPYLLLQNDQLAMKYFNMTGGQVFNAVLAGTLSLSQVSSALDKKLVSLNVYYRNLAYTSIEQEPKTEIVDLYNLFFFQI
jgi:hypothetical protein